MSESVESRGASGGGSGPSAVGDAVLGSGRQLCIFEEGGARFGLDVSLVGEVFVAERVVKLAMTPGAILGVFNCRGAPLPMVDLRALLGLTQDVRHAGDTAQTVLLVRRGPMQVGIRVERVEAVVEVGKLLPADERVDRHVEGLLELDLDERKQAPVQVLSAAFVVDRLKALRLRTQMGLQGKATVESNHD